MLWDARLGPRPPARPSLRTAWPRRDCSRARAAARLCGNVSADKVQRGPRTEYQLARADTGLWWPRHSQLAHRSGCAADGNRPEWLCEPVARRRALLSRTGRREAKHRLRDINQRPFPGGRADLSWLVLHLPGRNSFDLQLVVHAQNTWKSATQNRSERVLNFHFKKTVIVRK